MTNNNWQNIHYSFNSQLQGQWENHGFTYWQTKEWIDIGLSPHDANFVHWLETQGHTALALLNYGDEKLLRQDYEKSLTNPHQPFSSPQPTKPWWKLLIAFLLTLLATYFFTN